jgi:hypothetical protein
MGAGVVDVVLDATPGTYASSCRWRSDRVAVCQNEEEVFVSLPGLTVPEARAIIVADEALDLSYDQRLATGLVLDMSEGDAWRDLVASARVRIADFEKGRPRG